MGLVTDWSEETRAQTFHEALRPVILCCSRACSGTRHERSAIQEEGQRTHWIGPQSTCCSVGFRMFNAVHKHQVSIPADNENSRRWRISSRSLRPSRRRWNRISRRSRKSHTVILSHQPRTFDDQDISLSGKHFPCEVKRRI